MNGYDNLDAEIIAAIRRGRHPATVRVVEWEAERLAELNGRSYGPIITGRTIANRMQALRKAGRIRADRSAYAGWVIVGEQE